MDLADVKLGDVGALELDFVGGQLVLKIGVAKNGIAGGAVNVGANAQASVSPVVFLNMLKKAIPGEIDDKIIDLLAAAFIPKEAPAAAPQA